MDQHCREQRAEFINGTVKVREMFSFAHPSQVIFAIDKYCCSFYGSNICDLKSSAVESLCASWKTAMKLSWNVDRASHNYFIPSVLALDLRPLKASLLSRFHNFFRSTLDSPSHEVQIMARLSGRDVRSNFGSNLRLIMEKTGLDPWETDNRTIKNYLSIAETRDTPMEDHWRLQLSQKLLESRLQAYFYCDIEEETRLTEVIRSLMMN